MCSSIKVLGIESSCDDTSAAIVSHTQGENPEVLSLVVQNQSTLHEQYGGIVPEIAARAHSDRLDRCTIEALNSAQLNLSDLDCIAVTAGPGLIGGVISGVSFAKGLAAGSGLPLVGVNHLAAHALTVRLTHQVDFPFLCLLVSGGHCQFLAVLSPDDFIRLGGTIDDAPGEAFDKTARQLGLPQPGGPAIEKVAISGNPTKYAFPRPRKNQQGCNLSFSGLKTSLLRAKEKIISEEGIISETRMADLCASFQKAVSESLSQKSQVALKIFEETVGQKPTLFAISGGVAANQVIRKDVEDVCKVNEIKFYAPPLEYCTDNGAMIAWVGIEKFRTGNFDGFDLEARSRWPLDTSSSPILGGGKRGAKS